MGNEELRKVVVVKNVLLQRIEMSDLKIQTIARVTTLPVSVRTSA